MNFIRTLFLLVILLLFASARVRPAPRSMDVGRIQQIPVNHVVLSGETDETDEDGGSDEATSVQHGSSQAPNASTSSCCASRGTERTPAPDIVAEFTVTAYTANDPGMDGRGITATGTKATYGRTIAIDPKLIPYGSKIYIPALEHWPNKGWFIAEDTGGAIKGYRLDIFIPNRASALRFGRQRLEAHVYKSKENKE